MTAQVIEFKSRKVIKEEVAEVDVVKNNNQQAVVEEHAIVCKILLETLRDMNVDMNNEGFAKDFLLMAESIDSLLKRQYNLPHRFQEYVDENISVYHTQEGTYVPQWN